MASEAQGGSNPPAETGSSAEESAPSTPRIRWKQFLGVKRDSRHPSGILEGEATGNREKRTMGILSDKETDEVPGELLIDGAFLG